MSGFLQRLAISPDGRTVVFEVTDDFSCSLADFGLCFRDVLAPEQEGIFAIRSDGSGLRRIGDASRRAPFKFGVDPQSGELDGDFGGGAGFGFSPDGQLVAFTDTGFTPDGGESVQIFTLRLADAERRQVTGLAPLDSGPLLLEITGVTFTSADTIGFGIQAPGGTTITLVNVANGQAIPQQPPASAPDASILTAFAITGGDKLIYPLGLPGIESENVVFGRDIVWEIFVQAPDDLLQLTNLRRVDTIAHFVSADRRRVIFSASSNQLDTNAHHNCQLFTVDVLGGDLRQITDLDAGAPSSIGCFGASPGCSLFPFGYDAEADLVLFESSCDPLGGNPAGVQAFAVRSDGSGGLRQVTAARGVMRHGDSVVAVQFPGPFAHPQPNVGG